jgi:hypothetical protein
MSIFKCQPAIPSTVFNREQTLNCGIQIHYIGKVRQGGDLNVLFVSNSENQTKSSNKDFFFSRVSYAIHIKRVVIAAAQCENTCQPSVSVS